jgi:hypothetical protein
LTSILALLLLSPRDYGLFSIVYLIFAFGISLQYSILNEAWARALGRDLRFDSWDAFSSMLMALSVLVGLAAFLTSMAVPGLGPYAWCLALAVAFSLYRGGARYFSIAQGELRQVLISDLGGIGIFAVSVTVLSLEHLSVMWIVIGSWAASAAICSLVLRRPRYRRSLGPLSWIRSHHNEIRPLLVDSLLMDAGAIGTPFLLAGFMGSTRFGIYRAVSNVALPVRLLIDPIRPVLGRTSPARLFSRSSGSAISLVTLLMAAGCYLALTLVVPRIGFHVGTLSSLVPFALPASLFVAGSLLGTVYYIICRTNASHRHIVIGRIAQTVLVIAMPILGFALGGLGGAIWGFALSSVISGAVWVWFAYLSSQRS